MQCITLQSTVQIDAKGLAVVLSRNLWLYQPGELTCPFGHMLAPIPQRI
jgi:hypothetical protein